METILFLTPVEPDDTLSKPALEALGAAVMLHQQQTRSTLAVGLWGKNVQAAADALAGCGAAKFFALESQEFEVGRYASDAAAAAALIAAAQASLVLAPGNSRTARALPGVAVRCGGRIDSHIVALQISGAALHVQRWYYRQRLLTTLTRGHRPWCLLVEPGEFAPWQGAPGSVTLQRLLVPAATWHRTRVEGFESTASGAQTIRPDAELLLVAGAGWTKKQPDGKVHAQEAETLILDFLDATQASLGGSKSVVDQASEGGNVLTFMSHLHQVGQTGGTPRHAKGLATCCHGEEPHVVGWRFIRERRAINTNAGCGWAQGKADVLYVADAFEVMAKVNALLRRAD